jgi:hypothetical protein
MSTKHSVIAGAAAVSIALAMPVLANAGDSSANDAGQTTAPSVVPELKTEGSSDMTDQSKGGSMMSDLKLRTGFVSAQGRDQLRSQQLVGVTVGRGGEDLGSVADLLLDRDMQVIGYVVSVGGFLGIGDKQVAVSADKASIGIDRNGDRVLMVPYTKEQIEAAPTFISRDGSMMDIDETAELPRSD